MVQQKIKTLATRMRKSQAKLGVPKLVRQDYELLIEILEDLADEKTT